MIKRFGFKTVQPAVLFTKVKYDKTKGMRDYFEEKRRLGLKGGFSESNIVQLNEMKYEISESKISPIHCNVVSIKDFPIPNCKKDIQKFLGKINFYRKFVPNITKLLNPLYKLLKKNEKFEWNVDCQTAFDQVKQIFISKPVLNIFDPTKKIYLFTDASRVGIGGILKQEFKEKTLLPIGYFSKKLLPYQINYSITELECLAIVEAIEYFHHYLYNTNFTVITDHAALKWLKKIKKA